MENASKWFVACFFPLQLLNFLSSGLFLNLFPPLTENYLIVWVEDPASQILGDKFFLKKNVLIQGHAY